MEVININIFIAGSSYDTIDSKYLSVAKEVSKLIAKDNTLVNGGIPSGIPNNSMMGIYLKSFSNHKYLTVTKYANNLTLEEQEKTKIYKQTMDRTKEIYNISDILLFLPGGLGTLAELFGMIEEKRTNNDNKKIIIYNYNNYYDNILNHLTKISNEKFTNKDDYQNFIIVNNTNDLLKEMER